MAATGENRWPPVGRTRRPLTWRNRGGWGAAEAAQDLDVRPAGPLARLFRPPDVADLL